MHPGGPRSVGASGRSGSGRGPVGTSLQCVVALTIVPLIALCGQTNTTGVTLATTCTETRKSCHDPDDTRELVTVAKRGTSTAHLRDSPAARRFGADIKQVRVARRWTQKQLAEYTGYSETYVSRVEAGHWLSSEEFARACDLVFGTGHLFADQLERLIKGDKIPEWFAPYVELEARADRILDFSPVFPMGVLQTAAYAEAVYRAGVLAAKGEDIGPSLAARMKRRGLLDKEGAPLLWVVLTEGCLRTPVGPPAVMRDQLAYIADLADHPRVTIQVLPYKVGATPCPTPYTLLHSESKWSAYAEFPYGGRAYDDEEFVMQCTDLYDLLRARALSPGESVSYVREISSEVYQ